MSKEKPITHKHKVEITPPEERMLSELLLLGFMDPSEVFRLALRIFYKEEFLNIKKAKKNPLPVAEEKEFDCVAEGGEIVVDKGVRKCKITRGAITEYINI